MSQVKIYEVGPRDGLQNEKTIIPTQSKIELINHLSAAGFSNIEAASFVSPKWVPQMADAAEVMAGITRKPGVTYSALTPNLRGLERALEAGVDEVAIFGAASETFSQKNINCSIAESIERFRPVAELAKRNNIPVRGYVSCVVGCPYEGDIAPTAVRVAAEQMIALGCYEVSLGDTIGVGTPDTIRTMLEVVLEGVSADQLAGHYHDTNNRAVDNIFASLELGIKAFDSAIGGLGGCPYAPGAKGNVSTITLVGKLHEQGWKTGLDMAKLRGAETYLQREIKGLDAR
ncbi:MAG: hydroxymethylglutaryl-CoA lyase [Rhizobiales bacterium]|nr:hydroxymethylglutaryl-CoA lyase [Hyphomicrobiales bacterium]